MTAKKESSILLRSDNRMPANKLMKRFINPEVDSL
jgi:hypothetical protein